MSSAAVLNDLTVRPHPEDALSLEDVTAGYGTGPVFDRLSLRLQCGRIVGVLGPNGAGKTTLLRLTMGLLPPASGTVTVLGRELRSDADRAWARLRIGYVPQIQSPTALPITVADSVLLGRWGRSFRFLKRPNREDREVVQETLALVGISELAERDLATLSGGQRQRAALARALARRPRLLLMDEPTTYLDREAQQELVQLIERLHERLQITTLVVTHGLEAGWRFDRTVQLGEGGLDE